jgi:hypothetical protein
MVLLLHFLPLLAFVDSSAIGLDVVLFDHRAPELHLVRQELALHVRAANLQRDLHSLDAALDLGFAQCLRQRIAETIDDSARRAPGGERAPPGVRLETGKPLSITVGTSGRPGVRVAPV